MAWDVVNEAQADNGSGLKTVTPWYPLLPDYVDRAFIHARAADPDALLFYNDYNVITHQAKADAIVEMIKGMKSRGVPIDGMGIQFHVKDADTASLTRESVAATIKRFGDLGLQVHITEMDVKCPSCADSD